MAVELSFGSTNGGFIAPSHDMCRNQLLPLCLIASLFLASESRPGANDSRASILARAAVWTPTNVSAMDIKMGPNGSNAFPFRATVHCEYLDKKLAGQSPKFACRIGADDEVKVKFGGTNGEVYAEVAATRLLWALGFGADRIYPVRVICRDCPSFLYGTERGDDEFVFDPAIIERKMPGIELPGDEGWSWKELDLVDERAGGASRAQRDALKLMAVLLQHTDTKSKQQSVLCLDSSKAEAPASCAQPFMLINDVGLTFGRANTFNSNATGGMNLSEWSQTPVWKDEAGCVGNLPKSFTGTLDDPVISEEGRRFLADLLMQLSDQQLHDLFAVSRVTLRLRRPTDPRSGFATIEEWVRAFKEKREQIVNRRCA